MRAATSNGEGAEATLTQILLVEDHGPTAYALGTLLRQWGYEVTSVPSGAAALECLATHGYDILVSDIALYGHIDGYELMYKVKDKHGIPGVAISGCFEEGHARRAFLAGFADHFAKPVDTRKLRATLTRIISRLALKARSRNGGLVSARAMG